MFINFLTLTKLEKYSFRSMSFECPYLKCDSTKDRDIYEQKIDQVKKINKSRNSYLTKCENTTARRLI